MAARFPKQRKIGDDYVSAMGLGCMGMSVPTNNGPPDDEESLRTLTAAADMGINFWVTSDWYGPHTNERLLGRWFKETGRRDEIFLVSHFGTLLKDGKFAADSSPDYVKAACQGSLERLNTDHIDLYLQHRVDPKTPIEKTVEAMAELKKEGKIRYLGLSECSARTLERASAVHPITIAEMEFSPFALEIESQQTKILETARRLGIMIMAYSPLGRGFLTGAIKSPADVEGPRKMLPRFYEEHFADNLKIADAMEAVAKDKGCTPSQLALAWVMAQGDDFIPIPGTKHVKYLKQNADAVNVSLSKEEEEKIHEMVNAFGGAKGPRYPEAALAYCFGDSPEL